MAKRSIYYDEQKKFEKAIIKALKERNPAFLKALENYDEAIKKYLAFKQNKIVSM